MECGKRYFQTYSGIIIYFDDILTEDKIKLQDIAHSLSLLCRFNGQCKHFYSVGEHSINCLKIADSLGYDDDLKLYTLLHDASEAYLGDVVTPLKKQLIEYKMYEKSFQNVIFKRFGLSDANKEIENKLKIVDNACFELEWAKLMKPDSSSITSDDLVFYERNSTEVENDFITRAKMLIKTDKFWVKIYAELVT